MILFFKIFFVLLFIPLNYAGCFKNPLGYKWYKKLLFVIGIVPYSLLGGIAIHFVMNRLYKDSALIEHTFLTYTMFWIMPYILFLFRMVVMTVFSKMAANLSRKHQKFASKEKWAPNVEPYLTKGKKYGFYTMSAFYFVGGIFIVAMVSINEISNEPIRPVLEEEKILIEKWWFISEDNDKMNQLSDSLFKLPVNIESDTITFIFYQDNLSGWMLHKNDSINIQYSYNVDELELTVGVKTKAYKILNRSEEELNIVENDSTHIKFIKSD